MDDEIQIRGLTVSSRVGISEAERAAPQKLTVDLRLFPAGGLARLDDRIENTTDYAVVADEVRGLCEQGEWNLIETIAEEIADFVLDRYQPSMVEVEIRKFVLPDCDYVGVKIRRG